jgi:hypothetical protein
MSSLCASKVSDAFQHTQTSAYAFVSQKRPTIHFKVLSSQTRFKPAYTILLCILHRVSSVEKLFGFTAVSILHIEYVCSLFQRILFCPDFWSRWFEVLFIRLNWLWSMCYIICENELNFKFYLHVCKRKAIVWNKKSFILLLFFTPQMYAPNNTFALKTWQFTRISFCIYMYKVVIL